MQEQTFIDILYEEALRGKEVFLYDVRERLCHDVIGSPESEGNTLSEEALTLHPSDMGKFLKATNAIIKREKSVANVNVRHKGDEPGKWEYFRITLVPEISKDGEVEKIIYQCTVDTESLKREEEVANISATFQQLFEQSDTAQAYFDPQGRILGRNKMADEIFGRIFGLDQMPKLNLYDIYAIEDIVSANDPQPVDFCLRTRYDRYIEVSIRPFSDDNGQLLFISATVSEVTNIRNIFRETIQKRRQVEDTNSRVEDYAKRIVSLMEFGQIVMWNMRVDEKRFYYTSDLEDQWAGMTLEEFAQLMYDDSKELYHREIQKIIEGRNENVSMLVHVRHTSYSGDAWIAVSGVPVCDKDGKVTEFFGIQRDVSDMKNNEDELRRETEKTKNSAMLKTLFIENMTHEIRTPLNAIVGFSDLLHDSDPETKQQITEIIKANCLQLERMISNIFDISNMESEGVKMEYDFADFSVVFHNLCARLRLQVTNPKVEFIEDNPYSKCVLNIDRFRAEQVISNFVSNAIKFTDAGRIKTGYHYDGKNLYVYCEDTGRGIPNDRKKEIFERFVKVDNFVSGSGLGLAICKAIAEGGGGSIGVNSEPGRGSRFFVKIPAEAKEIIEENGKQ